MRVYVLEWVEKTVGKGANTSKSHFLHLPCFRMHAFSTCSLKPRIVWLKVNGMKDMI